MIDKDQPMLLEQSSRVALAALLHDMGKFAERARVEIGQDELESYKQLYCPHRKQSTDDPGYFTHIHAAYTAVAIDQLERKFPELVGQEMSPFASWKTSDTDDSLINAAARHHKPDTFLQWVVATADRVASGFEREEFDKYNQAKEETSTGKNHYTARQLTLFEQVSINNRKDKRRANFEYRYPLKPLSPGSIFPVKANKYESNNKKSAQNEYRKLWDQFIESLEQIPLSHRSDLTLWLDHFETLWGTYTHAIPSATAFNVRPEVSLYDHSRTTAALATSLWRYHHEKEDDLKDAAVAMRERNDDWEENKFLLIQGDFFGIQDFIFSGGGETHKRAAKLLRGRSFYVSLLTECAALKVLNALSLPPTSQVINAAGKFLIVAPNTEATLATLKSVQAELDEWFLQHTWGESGVGLAWQRASCMDFRRGKEGDERCPFRELVKALFTRLEEAKYQRLRLCDQKTPAVFKDYLDSFDKDKGVCKVNGRSPATQLIDKDSDVFVSALAKDQMSVGSYLVTHHRLLVTHNPVNDKTLKLGIFGFYATFTDNEDISGKFAPLVKKNELLRCWDFSLPESADKPLWNGYARRYVNAYIAQANDTDLKEEGYGKYTKAGDLLKLNTPKTLNHLACDDRKQTENGGWSGQVALMTLKGDVDNLGQIFQQGMGQPTFAKMAALSRQVNAFFAIYLPWLCQSNATYRNTYTVFAGGDDFFLIGPWHTQIRLAQEMRKKFSEYVAGNKEIHFSAGLSMTKPGLPVPYLGEMAEEALERAKLHNPEHLDIEPKNAVSCFERQLSWDEFEQLLQASESLSEKTKALNLSTGYVYGLLTLVDMAEKTSERPENAIWHSYFAYRTRRMLERQKGLNEKKRQQLQQELASDIVIHGIEKHKGDYRIALFTHLYQQRD